jgi:twitching motility protein PilT
MPEKKLEMEELLRTLVEEKGTDLHLTVGSPPRIRIGKRLISLDYPPLTPADTQRLCYSVLTEAQKKRFEEEHELDFSFGIAGLSRFRGNLFVQRGAVAGAFRVIPHRIPSMKELGLPPVVEELIRKPKGLILVTGPTGSGKSTTLAAMIDRINEERFGHIVTIEDPIEYLHRHKNCIVNQREVGSDTFGFHEALKHILRQDPDVVLIGEMRDLETIQAALTIAETGHLTLATLHTNTAVETINRIVDVFPPHQQQQVRTMLSFVLEGILCQRLLPRADGKGLVLALEILIPNPAIRNLIRENKIHQIYSQMQMGQQETFMQTLNQSLLSLYKQGLITLKDAMETSPDLEEFRRMLTTTEPRSFKERF